MMSFVKCEGKKSNRSHMSASAPVGIRNRNPLPGILFDLRKLKSDVAFLLDGVP
jgi:hypothetical protein